MCNADKLGGKLWKTILGLIPNAFKCGKHSIQLGITTCYHN